jgi:hypothetical protein
MVAEFLAGVLVGMLAGLALAPLLRSWVLWRMSEPWRRQDENKRTPSQIGVHIRP